jgi:cysteine synthase
MKTEAASADRNKLTDCIWFLSYPKTGAAKHLSGRIVAKLEMRNPCGSVKSSKRPV